MTKIKIERKIDLESYYVAPLEMKKTSIDLLSSCDAGEYFFNTTVGIITLIHGEKNKDIVSGYIFIASYDLQLYKNDNNVCDIVFKDINRPTLMLEDYTQTIVDFEEVIKSKDFSPVSTRGSSFENFILEATDNYLNNQFLKINEQSFFDTKINKKKVTLNQSLMMGLKRNFQKDISIFLEQLNKENYEDIKNKNEFLDVAKLKELKEIIKRNEVVMNYEKLSSEVIQQNVQKEKKHKI
jgi:hypothetical protein